MTQPFEKIQELTDPSSTDYFADDADLFFELQQRVNSELAPFPAPNTELLFINAPASVNIADKEELPMVVVRYASGMRNWQVSHALNAYVLVQDMENGAIKSNILALPGKEKARPPEPSKSGSRPDGFGLHMTTTSLNRYLLRDHVDIDWQSANLALTVIEFDAVSNTVLVKLHGDQKPSPSALPIVAPSSFLLAAEEAGSDKKDEAPAQLAITKKADSIILVGSINALASSLPKALSNAHASQPDIVLANIVIAALDQAPVLITLALPIQACEQTGETKLFGRFQFDATEYLPKNLVHGNIQVYLVAGLNTSSPVSISTDSATK